MFNFKDREGASKQISIRGPELRSTIDLPNH